MLTLKKNWIGTLLRRTIFAASAAGLLCNGNRLAAQVPAAAAAGGANAAAVGAAARPSVGLPAGGVVTPGVGVGRAVPPAVGIGGPAPGIGMPAVNGAANAALQYRNANMNNVNGAGTGAVTSPPFNPQANVRLNAANGQAGGGVNAAANSGAALPALRQNVLPNRAASANAQASSQAGLSGSVAAINATGLTFNNGGVESSFTLTPRTQFQINGRTGTFRDVPPDSNIQLFTNPRNPRQVERIVATTGGSQATQSQFSTQGSVAGQAAVKPASGTAPASDAAGSRSYQQYLNGDTNGGNDYFIPNEPRGKTTTSQTPLRKWDTQANNVVAPSSQNGVTPAAGTSNVNPGANPAGSRSYQQYLNGDTNGGNDYFIPNQPREISPPRNTPQTPSQSFNDAAKQNRNLKSQLDAAKKAAKQ